MIVRMPAISCIKHSDDTQEEPAGSKAPAATQQQPAFSEAPAAAQEQPASSKAPAATQKQPAGSKALAAAQEQPAASRAASQRGSAGSVSTFFGRDIELRELELLGSAAPDLLHVVVGPRSCGKTLTLKEFQRNRQKVYIINLRGMDARMPAPFVSAVLKALAQAAPRSAFDAAVQRLQAATDTEQAATVLAGLGGVVESVNLTARSFWGGPDVSFDTGTALVGFWRKASPSTSLASQGDNLNAVLGAKGALLDAWVADKQQQHQQQQQWPVLIVDEANKLMRWKDTHPEQLEQLLSTLVRVCKEDGLCHVILATSEWGFIAWLEEGIGFEFYKAEVIGDFPEPEAREFFELELQQRGMELREATWNKVFEVGGGNAGFLRAVAAEVAKRKISNNLNWEAVKERQCDIALAQLVAPRWEATEKHVEGGDGWSEKQYAAAAEKLLRTQYNAVPRKEMAMLLGKLAKDGGKDTIEDLRVGRQVLQKMVAANALAVRPCSSWARDVPEEAFKGANLMVTAPSAVALHCMRCLLQPTEEELL